MEPQEPTPSTRRQPLINYVLNYLREKGYRLFSPGRGNAEILRLPPLNRQQSETRVTLEQTSPGKASTSPDTPILWFDAIQEQKPDEDTFIVNDEIDTGVSYVLECLISRIEVDDSRTIAVTKDEEPSTSENGWSNLSKTESEDLNRGLEPVRYLTQESKKRETENEEPTEEEIFGELMEDDSFWNPVDIELQVLNTLEHEYQITEESRETLRWILDQIEHDSEFQPNDVVSDTELLQGATEDAITEEYSETIVTEKTFDTTDTDGNYETMFTEENIEAMFAQENIESTFTEENIETMFTEENIESTFTEKKFEMKIKKNSYMELTLEEIPTESNLEKMVTKVNYQEVLQSRVSVESDLETRDSYVYLKASPSFYTRPVDETWNEDEPSSSYKNSDIRSRYSDNILKYNSHEDLVGSGLKRCLSYYALDDEISNVTSELITIHQETYEVPNKPLDQFQETNEMCNVNRDELYDTNVILNLSSPNQDPSSTTSKNHDLPGNVERDFDLNVSSENSLISSIELNNGQFRENQSSNEDLESVNVSSTSSLEKECLKKSDKYDSIEIINTVGYGDFSAVSQSLTNEIGTPIKILNSPDRKSSETANRQTSNENPKIPIKEKPLTSMPGYHSHSIRRSANTLTLNVNFKFEVEVMKDDPEPKLTNNSEEMRGSNNWKINSHTNSSLSREKTRVTKDKPMIGHELNELGVSRSQYSDANFRINFTGEKLNSDYEERLRGDFGTSFGKNGIFRRNFTNGRRKKNHPYYT